MHDKPEEMIAVVEGREPPGWQEVDPANRALALAALRQAAVGVLIQRVPAAEAFAVVGEMVGRYEEIERRTSQAMADADRELGLDPSDVPKIRHLRHMKEEERVRYRIFLGIRQEGAR